MNSKVYIILNKAYKYFKASFYFWLYLLRGLAVYGLIPSACSLFSIIEDIKQNEDRDEIKKLFSLYYRQYSIYKVQSLIFSFIIILIYAFLFFLNKVNNKISLILTIVLIYSLAMILLILTYTINYLVVEKYNFKKSLIYSFVSTVKNIFASISILISFIILFTIGKMNLIFLIFLTPFIYILSVKALLNKWPVVKEETQWSN